MIRQHRLALLLLVVTIVGVQTSAASEPSVEGVYLSRGVDPTGAEHHGIVHIRRHGDGVLVAWMIPDHEDGTIVLVPVAAGIGLVDGGMLAVSYFTPKAGGLLLFRIEEQGRRLTGRRLVAGDDGTAYSETLTKVPGDSLGPPATDPDQRAPDPSGSDPPAAPRERVSSTGRRAVRLQVLDLCRLADPTPCSSSGTSGDTTPSDKR
jgi:hypothetical protein